MTPGDDPVLIAARQARAAAANKAKHLTISARTEPCRTCKANLTLCPGVHRVFTRCCNHCTHLTQTDLDYLAMHPGHLEHTHPERLDNR